jgi:hypothetical protein
MKIIDNIGCKGAGENSEHNPCIRDRKKSTLDCLGQALAKDIKSNWKDNA